MATKKRRHIFVDIRTKSRKQVEDDELHKRLPPEKQARSILAEMSDAQKAELVEKIQRWRREGIGRWEHSLSIA